MPAANQSSRLQAPVVYRGSIPGSGRRPKTDDRQRRCALKDCDTVLSRYNLGDLCRVHAPLRFPRTRGRPLGDAESV